MQKANVNIINMLGHLRPSSCGQNTESKAHYQHLYCSICAGLRSTNNTLYTAFINNEMTLVLQSIKPYMTGLAEIETPCPSALFTRKNKAFTHPAISKAADISVLLGWIKVSDCASDSPAFYKSILKKNLDLKCKKMMLGISEELKHILANYICLTVQDSENYPVVKSSSGALSEACFLSLSSLVEIPKKDQAVLADLFRLSGEFVSLADHLIDFEEDRIKQQYNPILDEDESTFIENYQYYRQEFHRIEDQLLKIVRSLHKLDVSDRHFVNSFQQAIFRMSASVDQHKPIQLEGTPNSEMIQVAAGCSGETCANSADTWAPMINNCDNCDNGCDNMENGCDNCDSGCDNCSNSCNDIGDSCDSCTFFQK